MVEKKKTSLKKHSCDVLVIGAGVSGFAAGMYSSRFNLKTIVVGEMDGGKITWTDDVSNYPGFIQLTGLELANKIKEHAIDNGAEIVSDLVYKIEKKKKEFIVHAGNNLFKAKTIIYATGAKDKKLGIKREEELTGKGVHTCALCDALFYKNKVVGVIGGSDSAGKEALFLAQHCKKVYIIYRGEKIRPEPINTKRIEENKKIEVINKTNVVSLNGKEHLESVGLDREYNGKKELKLDGIFVDIGSVPLTDLAKEVGVKLNSKGEIKINRNAETNVPGFFAAGDCVDSSFKQAITGVSEGVIASYFAFEYIKNNFSK